MKTILRLILIFIVVFVFSISCNKERDGCPIQQKNSFIYDQNSSIFCGRTYSPLHRVMAVANGLNFAVNVGQKFTLQSSPMNFTGSGITPEITIPGGCLVSTMGEPEQEEWGWIFHYHDDGSIDYIQEFEEDEKRIFFTYNSKKQIIMTEIYQDYDGEFELELYDEFFYNSKGQVFQVDETYINWYQATMYYSYNTAGQAITMTSDFYDTQETYQYSNGNVVKIVTEFTYGGVYTETAMFQFDNKNNFWKPLNIPQPFFTFFAWMESKNNMTVWTTHTFEGDVTESSWWYEYNAEGYPSWMHSEDDAAWGRIEYINCSK